jgi:hypothetical protein
VSTPSSTIGASTWGTKGERADVRALRRYASWQALLLNVGEWIAIVQVLLVIVAIGCAFAFLNFENVIFNDGTDTVCVLDGGTGVIQNVR